QSRPPGVPAAPLDLVQVAPVLHRFHRRSSLGNRPGRRAPRDGTIAAHSPTEDPMSHDLLEATKDGVAVLTLNRPDRLNAMSPPMLDALLEALPRLAEDPEVGVVVLTGAGRGFCAGGDIKAMAEGGECRGTPLG